MLGDTPDNGVGPDLLHGERTRERLERGLCRVRNMSLPVSRRALLTAVLPFASGEAENLPGADEPRPSLLATLSTANACVERHGIDCRRCAEVCDRSAIRILAREKLGAVIDAAACSGCGDCVPVYPVEAIAMVPRERVELVSEVARLLAGHG